MARTDPLVAYRFEISVDNMAVGGFSSCSGLQMEVEVHRQWEGGHNDFQRVFPGRTSQSPITLQRGVVDRSLWDWYEQTMAGEIELRGSAIRVLSDHGQTSVEWDLYNAFPSKWIGPDLDAGQSSVAVETFEISHNGLKRRTR